LHCRLCLPSALLRASALFYDIRSLTRTWLPATLLFALPRYLPASVPVATLPIPLGSKCRRRANRTAFQNYSKKGKHDFYALFD
jgi:hypothetical protein